jgi:hypothetical protein
MYVRAHHVVNNNRTASLVSVNLLFKPPCGTYRFMQANAFYIPICCREPVGIEYIS